MINSPFATKKGVKRDIHKSILPVYSHLSIHSTTGLAASGNT